MLLSSETCDLFSHLTERPRNHTSQIATLGPHDKPLSLNIPEHDPKWRFFWRMGPAPKKTNFPLLNMNAVIPSEIPEWSEVMDAWGNKMLDTLQTVSEMAALGFDLPIDTFTKRLSYGPHLLAPTGSDYSVYNKEGTVLAGFHYDLNFLTLHGKSRYPGLYIWTKNGKKVAVAVPTGCLLIQVSQNSSQEFERNVNAYQHKAQSTAFLLRDINLKSTFITTVDLVAMLHLNSIFNFLVFCFNFILCFSYYFHHY